MTHKKNKLYSVLVILAIGSLASCTKEMEYENDEPDSALTKSALTEQKIQAEDVLKALAQQASMDICEEEVREMLSYRYPHKNISEIKAICEEGLPVFYQVAFDQGYALVSADKRTEPIMAFSEEDSFSYEECNNSAFLSWLRGEMNIITAVKKENPKVENENTKYWSTFGKRIQVYKFSNDNQQPAKTKSANDEDVHWVRLKINSELRGFEGTRIPHLVTARWGQNFPWNAYTPKGPLNEIDSVHCMTGETAVAVGQMLHYLCTQKNMPVRLYRNMSYTYRNITVDQTGASNVSSSWYEYKINTPLGVALSNPMTRWNSMALNSSDSNTAMVADLLADVGAHLDQSYFFEKRIGNWILPPILTTSIDVAHIANIGQTFNYFGVSTTSSSFDFNQVLSSVVNAEPVLVVSDKPESQEDSYFQAVRSLVDSWIIDGVSNGVASYLTEYLWIMVDDPDHLLEEQEGQIIYGDNNGNNQPGVGHYNGEREFVIEYVNENYYLANWGKDGDDNDSQITSNASGILQGYDRAYNLFNSIMYFNFESNN